MASNAAGGESDVLMERLVKRGAASVELALHEGLLRWVDSAGRPVAWARATPTLAWEPRRATATWAAAWRGMAGVTCTPAPPGPPERSATDGALPQRWAQEAAERAGLMNLAVPLGPPTGAVLHLALGPVTQGDWPGGRAAIEGRRAEACRWAADQLERITRLVTAAPAAEAEAALFELGAMAAMSASALNGTPEGAALKAMAGRAETWARRLADAPLWVQVAISRERARWVAPEARIWAAVDAEAERSG